jgi:hypothetical protein
MVERNMCNAVMRGIAVPPGSKSTSRANGLRRSTSTSSSDVWRVADVICVLWHSETLTHSLNVKCVAKEPFGRAREIDDAGE